jgi:hypothetical protein
MARTYRKDRPRPLLTLRPHFITSLDHTLQQALLLVQAVELALDQNMVENKSAAEVLKARSEALRSAMFPKEPE